MKFEDGCHSINFTGLYQWQVVCLHMTVYFHPYIVYTRMPRICTSICPSPVRMPQICGSISSSVCLNALDMYQRQVLEVLFGNLMHTFKVTVMSLKSSHSFQDHSWFLWLLISKLKSIWKMHKLTWMRGFSILATRFVSSMSSWA